MITPLIHDPNAVLDYTFDWATSYLGADTIIASQFSVDSGIMVESDTFDATSATIWLSGGTPDKRYAVVNHVTTAGGREDDWTIYLLVKDH